MTKEQHDALVRFDDELRALKARVTRRALPSRPDADGWRPTKTAITIEAGPIRSWESLPRTATLIVHGSEEARAAYHAAVLALVTAGFEVEESEQEKEHD